jgi:hypothetical protein
MSLNKLTGRKFYDWMEVHCNSIRTKSINIDSGGDNSLSITEHCLTIQMLAGANLTKGQLLQIDPVTTDSVIPMENYDDVCVGVCESDVIQNEIALVCLKGLASILVETGEVITQSTPLKISSLGGGLCEHDTTGESTIAVAIESVVGTGSNLVKCLYNTGNNNKYLNNLRGQVDGLATLDSAGKVPASQLSVSNLLYKGLWNSLTNVPSIISGVGINGEYYIVQIASTGVTTIDGESTWEVGDWILFSGDLGIWQRIDTQAAVNSVNSKVGDVTIESSDITGLDTSITTLNNKTSTQTVVAGAVVLTGDINTGINRVISDKLEGRSTSLTLISNVTSTGKIVLLADPDGVFPNKIELDPGADEVKLVNTSLNMNSNEIKNIHGTTLGQVVQTDISNKLVSVVKNNAHNKSFGTTAGTVAEGDTVQTGLNSKLDLSGGTLTGDLTMGSNNIITNGTVDGRDVSADGVILDNIPTLLNGKLDSVLQGWGAEKISSSLYVNGNGSDTSVDGQSMYIDSQTTPQTGGSLVNIYGTAGFNGLKVSLGNIAVDGTVDGRDVSADGTILDGIPDLLDDKLDLAGGTMTGNLNMNNNSVSNIAGTTLGQILETNNSNQLVSASKNTAYNRPFGTTAGTVAEGNAVASDTSKYDKTGGVLTGDVEVEANNATLKLKNTSALSAFGAGIAIHDGTDLKRCDIFTDETQKRLRVQSLSALPDSKLVLECIDTVTSANSSNIELTNTAFTSSVDFVTDGDATINGLTATTIVHTDASKKLVSVTANTAYNRPFGTTAGTVAEGNAITSDTSKYDKTGGVLTGNVEVEATNATLKLKNTSALSAFGSGIALHDNTDLKRCDIFTDEIQKRLRVQSLSALPDSKVMFECIDTANSGNSSNIELTNTAFTSTVDFETAGDLKVTQNAEITGELIVGDGSGFSINVTHTSDWDPSVSAKSPAIVLSESDKRAAMPSVQTGRESVLSVESFTASDTRSFAVRVNSSTTIMGIGISRTDWGVGVSANQNVAPSGSGYVYYSSGGFGSISPSRLSDGLPAPVNSLAGFDAGDFIGVVISGGDLQFQKNGVDVGPLIGIPSGTFHIRCMDLSNLGGSIGLDATIQPVGTLGIITDILTVDGNSLFIGDISVSGTVDNRDIAVDGSALDGIPSLLNTKLNLAGGTMTGNIDMNSNAIENAPSFQSTTGIVIGSSSTTGNIIIQADSAGDNESIIIDPLNDEVRITNANLKVTRNAEITGELIVGDGSVFSINVTHTADWDPSASAKSPAIVLSESDKRAAMPSPQTGRESVVSVASFADSATRSFALRVNSATTSMGIGISTSAWGVGVSVGGTPPQGSGFLYFSEGGIVPSNNTLPDILAAGATTAFTTGDIIGMIISGGNLQYQKNGLDVGPVISMPSGAFYVRCQDLSNAGALIGLDSTIQPVGVIGIISDTLTVKGKTTIEGDISATNSAVDDKLTVGGTVSVLETFDTATWDGATRIGFGGGGTGTSDIVLSPDNKLATIAAGTGAPTRDAIFSNESFTSATTREYRIEIDPTTNLSVVGISKTNWAVTDSIGIHESNIGVGFVYVLENNNTTWRIYAGERVSSGVTKYYQEGVIPGTIGTNPIITIVIGGGGVLFKLDGVDQGVIQSINAGDTYYLRAMDSSGSDLAGVANLYAKLIDPVTPFDNAFWDPLKKSSIVTLNEGNKLATVGIVTGNEAVLSVDSFTESSELEYRIECVGVVDDMAIGISTTSWLLNTAMGGGGVNDGIVYFSGGTNPTGGIRRADNTQLLQPASGWGASDVITIVISSNTIQFKLNGVNEGSAYAIASGTYYLRAMDASGGVDSANGINARILTSSTATSSEFEVENGVLKVQNVVQDTGKNCYGMLKLSSEPGVVMPVSANVDTEFTQYLVGSQVLVNMMSNSGNEIVICDDGLYRINMSLNMWWTSANAKYIRIQRTRAGVSTYIASITILTQATLTTESSDFMFAELLKDDEISLWVRDGTAASNRVHSLTLMVERLKESN